VARVRGTKDGEARPHGCDVAAAYHRTAIHWQAAGPSPPNYLRPVADWDGMGDNYDSQTYGTGKGYHSSRVASSR
jgi:hypothetical protein